MRAQVANIKKQLEDADLFSMKLMIDHVNEKVGRTSRPCAAEYHAFAA